MKKLSFIAISIALVIGAHFAYAPKALAQGEIINPTKFTSSTVANNLPNPLVATTTNVTNLNVTSSLIVATTSPVAIPNIGGQIYLPNPTQLAAGANCGTATGVTDIMVCIQDYYSAATASGTTVYPGPYLYNYSTQLHIDTNQKFLFIACVPNVTMFNWQGTGTSTVWNYGSSASASGYGAHTYGSGADGCTWLGPGAAGTTTMASVGGTQGAEGWRFTNNRIIGYGQWLSLGNNVWNINVNYNLPIGNGKNITSITQTNAGERDNFIGNTFGDVAGTVTSSTLETCLDINGMAGANWTANNSDDCGVTFRSTARGVNINGWYFENPGASSVNYPAYKYITTTNGNTTIQASNLSFMQDSTSVTSTPSAFISNTGVLAIGNIVIQNNGTSTPLIVTDAASTAQLQVTGAVNYAGNSFTRIDEQAPTSTSGLQAPYASFGSSVPSFSVSTGTITGYYDQFKQIQMARIILGSATTTSNVVTFGKAWNSIPYCVISPATGTTAEWIPRFGITTTSTFTYGDATAMPANSAAVMICVGNPN